MMWVKSVLAKYWILLCCGAFLLVGLQNEVSVYQIGYMAIFLFILICYQVIGVFHNDTTDMEQFSNDCQKQLPNCDWLNNLEAVFNPREPKLFVPCGREQYQLTRLCLIFF